MVQRDVCCTLEPLRKPHCTPHCAALYCDAPYSALLPQIREEYCFDECGGGYTDLATHFIRNPECIPPSLQDASDSDDDAEEDDDDEEEDDLVGAHVRKQDLFASNDIRSQVAFDLNHLRFARGLDGADITVLKRAVRGWVREYIGDAAARLRPLLQPGTTEQTVVGVLTRDIFAGIETEKKELAFVKGEVPYLEPRVVTLGENEVVASFCIIDLLERRLQSDATFRRSVIAASELWKKGDRHCKTSVELNDIMDGTVARFHPHLQRLATADECDDVRVALLFNCDDIEVFSIT